MIVRSCYTTLTHKSFETINIDIINKLIYQLPFWFVNWPRKKIAKVNGCSFIYMESKNKKPKPSALYANQFITVYSNITRDDTEYLPASYEDLKRPSQSESDASAGFILLANNIYNNQKIYDLMNSSERIIEMWFKDAYGNIIPVKPRTLPTIAPGMKSTMLSLR
jgi:hypothetical protein